jgi:hypothetical protein
MRLVDHEIHGQIKVDPIKFTAVPLWRSQPQSSRSAPSLLFDQLVEHAEETRPALLQLQAESDLLY